jgi:hypothetical protein
MVNKLKKERKKAMGRWRSFKYALDGLGAWMSGKVS